MKDSPDLRRRHLAAIHAEKRRLNLCDEAYRNILAALTGKRSSGIMTPTQRATVIEFFRHQDRSPQPQPDSEREVVTDEEALEILGMAA